MFCELYNKSLNGTPKILCRIFLWYRNVVLHSLLSRHALVSAIVLVSIYLLISLCLFYIINSANKWKCGTSQLVPSFYGIPRVQVHVQIRDHHKPSIENSSSMLYGNERTRNPSLKASCCAILRKMTSRIEGSTGVSFRVCNTSRLLSLREVFIL